MQKKRIWIPYIKILLNAIFIFYAASITFFPHRHHIDEVTIVHSHPYAKDCDGNPSHSHTKADILTIQALTVTELTDFIIWIVALSLPVIVVTVLYATRNDCYCNQCKKLYRLRSPPVSIFYYSSI